MSLACQTCPVRDSAACSVLDDEERERLAAAGAYAQAQAWRNAVRSRR